MTQRSARSVAEKLPYFPGVEFRAPVEVALAYMQLHDLEFVGMPSAWRGVVRPAKEVEMSLQDVLRNLLEKSLRTRSAARWTLSGGLEIAIYDFRDGRIGLQLARGDVYPSVEEWDTVMRYFPGRVEGDDPKRFPYGRKFFLKGELRRVDDV